MRDLWVITLLVFLAPLTICLKCLSQEEKEVSPDDLFAQGRYAEVIQACRKEMAEHPQDKALCARHTFQIALARENLGETKDTLPILEGLLKSYPKQEEPVVAALLKLGELYSRIRDWDQAARCYQELDRRFPNTPEGLRALRQLADIRAKQGDYAEAAMHYERLTSLDPTAVEEIYPSMIAAWLYAGEYAKALDRAVLHYTVSSARGGYYRSAAEKVVARAMKANGWPLRKVQQFFDYQEFGPAGKDGKEGTGDDLFNPLADWVPLKDPQRDRLFRSAVEKCQDNLDGCLKRARLYILSYQPRKALHEMRNAFEVHDMDMATTQRAANKVFSAFTLLHRDARKSSDFANFLVFGPKGKDGKAGTADDLSNPLTRF